MITGIDVILHTKTQTGTDPLGAPIYTRTTETVQNVLVGEPTADDLINELQLYGKRLAYTLAIPKGDSHDWDDAEVEFFGKKFRTYGTAVQGIEHLVPLNWNKKVKVEAYG